MTRRTRTLTALAAVVVTAAAVLAAGPGYDAAQVRMHPGTAWLASNRTGEVALADGSSAELTAKVSVGEPGAVLDVTQHGSGALVLDEKTGGLSRVDSATLEIVRSTAELSPGPGLVVRATPDAVYGVDVRTGTVTVIAPDTLRPQDEPRQLATAIRQDSVVVDGRGRLWAIDDRTGDVVWLDGGMPRARSNPTKAGRLALAGGQVAFVDPERDVAELLHPETGTLIRSVRLDLPDGDITAISGSADRQRLLIADSTHGDLVVCTFDTSSCGAPVHIASPGAALGTPVETNDHAIVPDYSTGQAAIVDLADSQVVAHRQLFERPTRFELIVRDGIVFFNDPEGTAAGVLDLTGVVRTITKYTQGEPEGSTPAKPDRREQADQVVRRVEPTTKPSPQIPGQPDRPHQTAPPLLPPAPAASIVVQPGNRGVVGDQFELTMVLQPAGAATTTRWWFGDGTEDAGATTTHVWQRPGAFTVRAVSTYSTGGQVQAETTVTIDPPQAPPRITQLTVRRPKPVIGESVHFSADSSGKPDKWAWTVTMSGEHEPEVTSGTPEFAHAFSTPGIYTVALTVTAGGKTAQSSKQFTVARGAVKGWGFNMFGALEIPSTAESGVIAIDAGRGHSLALKSDGSVIAWGPNAHIPPAEASSGIVAISAGELHSLALKADGSVIAWGENRSGQATVPPEAKKDVVAISAGELHNLALKADGTVIGWGDDTDGRATPPPSARSSATAISAGTSQSMVLKADGTVIVWGSTGNGEQFVPPEANGDVRSISASYIFCSSLKADGSVVSWGNNSYGQLAVPPAAKSGVIELSTGTLHSLALKADGTVVGWGRNTWGETDIPTEYSVGVMSVAAGEFFSLVLVEGLD